MMKRSVRREPVEGLSAPRATGASTGSARTGKG